MTSERYDQGHTSDGQPCARPPHHARQNAIHNGYNKNWAAADDNSDGDGEPKLNTLVPEPRWHLFSRRETNRTHCSHFGVGRKPVIPPAHLTSTDRKAGCASDALIGIIPPILAKSCRRVAPRPSQSRTHDAALRYLFVRSLRPEVRLGRNRVQKGSGQPSPASCQASV